MEAGSEIKPPAAGNDQVPDPDDLETLLRDGDARTVRAFLRTLHPADLAMLFDRVDRDLWPRIVSNQSIAEISDLMEELDDHLRDDLAELLHRDQLVGALGEMDSDDAADVIADLPETIAQAVLNQLTSEDRQEVETLLAYPEDSAGGIMQVELVSVRESATVDEAIEAIRAKVDEVESIHFVWVTDDQERLIGMLPLDKLILAKPTRRIGELADRKYVAVGTEVDQEEVAQMFQRYDLVSMAVIDPAGKLLGRITHDDIIDVIEEEMEEDILRMAGAEEPELVYTNRIFKIASVRLPWLLVTVAGGLLSGWVLWQFKVTFPQILALLTFVPVIAAMGGNIGSQSSTIVVRGFATGRIDYDNLGRFLLRELAIGSMMGVACGLVLGLVARIWHGDLILGLTVGVSMTLAISASAVMGVLVPYLFRLVRVDPAIAAGPMVTTSNDIMGLFIYYAVALAILT
jgi:magnesium transporter